MILQNLTVDKVDALPHAVRSSEACARRPVQFDRRRRAMRQSRVNETSDSALELRLWYHAILAMGKSRQNKSERRGKWIVYR